MPKVYLPLLLVLAILLSSPLLLTRDSWLAEESSKGPRGKGLESDAELICIPFSRVEEDVIGRFKLSTNITYRVGKTTVYTSLNISDLAFYSYAVVEHSEPADFAHRYYIEFLVERAVRGDFSEDMKWEIEVARRERGGYLDELVSWLDKNMSTDEMVSRVLDRMDDDIGRLSFIHLEYYGAYQMLYLLSKNETYVITSCNPPFDPPQDNKWYYISNWQQAGRVWVGCYSSGEPDMHHFLGEFCTSTYTTNLNYYWNSARSGGCGVPGSQVNSIQVKFFYRASIEGYSWPHDMIWEVNKNATREWSKYYVRYKTTNPPAGYYMFSNYRWVLSCCSPPRNYCNTHCGSCFACDIDATQHFVKGQPGG
ncbi:MAG: hypothetical protein QXJ48_04780 [Candidatus Korarchaeum sp.]